MHKDEREFLIAYDQFADAIFRHCFFRTRDRERAKDVVQETFMRTWEYVAKGHKVENLRAFLYRVANNLIVDEARKKKPVSLDMLREEKGFEPRVDSIARAHDIIDAKGVPALLDKLEPHHREVVVMRYLDGFGPKEIAEILGESENAISVRLHRAMERLRKLYLAYE